MDEEQKILKKNNRILYITSRLFSKRIKNDIYKLYSFLFVLDNYAKDKSSAKKILDLQKKYSQAMADSAFESIAHRWDDADTRIIKYIVRLSDKYKFEPAWVESIFKYFSLEAEGKEYKTFESFSVHFDDYTNAIGQIIVKILKLPEEATLAVQAQVKAIEWLNYLRAISRDSAVGRLKFPKEDLVRFDLKSLDHEEASAKSDKFNKFIQFQLKRYDKWQTEANKGVMLVRERLQVSIRSGVDAYAWLAHKIGNNPYVIYGGPINPRRRRILRQIIRHTAGGTARVTVRTSRSARKSIKRVRPATKAAIPKIKEAPTIAKEKAKELTDKYIEIDE